MKKGWCCFFDRERLDPHSARPGPARLPVSEPAAGAGEAWQTPPQLLTGHALGRRQHQDSPQGRTPVVSAQRYLF
jgi:hypothetical protein